MIRPKRMSEEAWGRESSWATRFRALVKPRALSVIVPAMAVAAFAVLLSGSTLSKLGIGNDAKEPAAPASQEVLGIKAEAPADTIPAPPAIADNKSRTKKLPPRRPTDKKETVLNGLLDGIQNEHADRSATSKAVETLDNLIR